MLFLGWLMGGAALCAISFGLALLIDPANFAPTQTDPRALRRRRIVGVGSFLLMASILGWLAFLILTVLPPFLPERGWFASLQGGMNLLGGCSLILIASTAILVWFQIARRTRDRRRPNRY